MLAPSDTLIDTPPQGTYGSHGIERTCSWILGSVGGSGCLHEYDCVAIGAEIVEGAERGISGVTDIGEAVPAIGL